MTLNARAQTLSQGHEMMVKEVLRHGYDLTDENGSVTRESEAIMLTVQHPDQDPRVHPLNQIKGQALDQYAHDLIYGGVNDEKFDYTYWRRLFRYGADHPDQEQVDQFALMIEKLNEAPTTRRAQAITWDPRRDPQVSEVPCLQMIQATIRNNALNLKAVFRSNDILQAAGANMYALVQLQRELAAVLILPVGTYTHIALIPHIYLTRDQHEIPQWRDLTGVHS